MTRTELEGLFFKIDDAIIPPEFTYDKYDIETEKYTNFKLVKTGEQVWLENKDKPIEPQESTELEILKEELAEANKRSVLLEENNKLLAQNVYDLTTIVEMIITGGTGQ